MFSYGRHILQSLRLAKGTHEPTALNPRPAQHPPFSQDDGPGNQAESEENEKNCLGDEARFINQVNDFTADECCQRRRIMHFDFWRMPALIIDQGCGEISGVNPIY